MEQLAIEVAKQVPSLLVLAWVVHRFIGAITLNEERCHQAMSSATERMERAVDKQDAVIREVGKALHENTTAITSLSSRCMAIQPKHNID